MNAIACATVDTFRNQIIHCDAITLLKSLPDGCVDMVLTDPPYAAGRLVSARRSPLERFQEIEGNEFIQDEWLSEAFRVLKPESDLFCFASWRNNGLWQIALQKAGFTIKNCIVWDKVIHGLGDLESGFAFQHEFIIYAAKGRGKIYGNRPHDIVRIQRVDPKLLSHPYEKPLALIEWIMKKGTEPGDLVLDPFCGSGTTALAARNTGRHWICGDITAEYVTSARERLSQPYTPDMFDTLPTRDPDAAQLALFAAP